MLEICKFSHEGTGQIIVSSSEEDLQQDEGNIWDSGKVSSAQLVNISYAGEPLSSANRYYWKVRTWDAEGQVSPYSEVAWFETALMSDVALTDAEGIAGVKMEEGKIALVAGGGMYQFRTMLPSLE